MADTFSNDLRLRLQESGSNAGTWGDLLNDTITNIASALGQGSEVIPNASTHTITLADGTADEARSLYLKCTGGGQACTVTLGPNTISKVWIIDNATAYTLTFSQGSGANVAIAAGAVKVIATDGAGSGAAVVDTLDGLEGSLSSLTVTGAATMGGLAVDGDGLLYSASNVEMRGNANVRISLGTAGTSGANNNSNWIYGNGTNLRFNNAGGFYSWETLGTERMRIESDGKINIGSVGNISPYGIRFAINGTGSGGAGLYFGSGVIIPTDNTPTITDANVDLGASNYRFKDIYLSGGVNFSANANAAGMTSETLDDYETGTFTPTIVAATGTQPTITYGQNTGTYTKVGQLVTLIVYFEIASISGTTSGTLNITGLPFNQVSGNGYAACGAFASNGLNFARTPYGSVTQYQAHNMGFLTANNNAAWSWESVAILSAGDAFRFTISYHTAA